MTKRWILPICLMTITVVLAAYGKKWSAENTNLHRHNVLQELRMFDEEADKILLRCAGIEQTHGDMGECRAQVADLEPRAVLMANVVARDAAKELASASFEQKPKTAQWYLEKKLHVAYRMQRLREIAAQ